MPTPLASARANRPWTRAEIAYLRQTFAQERLVDIGAHLGRSRRAVEVKAHQLQLEGKRNWWSADDDALLEARYASTSTDELVEELGRSRMAVTLRARRLGLRKRPALSPEATELLLELHEEPGIVEYFAEHFGVSEAAVRRVVEKGRAERDNASVLPLGRRDSVSA